MSGANLTHSNVLDWLVPSLLGVVITLLGWMSLSMSDIKASLATTVIINGNQDEAIKEMKTRIRDIEIVIYRAPPPPPPLPVKVLPE